MTVSTTHITFAHTFDLLFLICSIFHGASFPGLTNCENHNLESLLQGRDKTDGHGEETSLDLQAAGSVVAGVWSRSALSGGGR